MLGIDENSTPFQESFLPQLLKEAALLTYTDPFIHKCMLNTSILGILQGAHLSSEQNRQLCLHKFPLRGIKVECNTDTNKKYKWSFCIFHNAVITMEKNIETSRAIRMKVLEEI